MDLESIGTGLAILGASEATKDSIQRMLAPTADYIGVGILNSTKASVNLARVLVHATTRLRQRRIGGVPPRVLKTVLDEAPFVDDELVAAYYGGVLAASCGDRPRDDRAMAHLATMKRLSGYSIKLHYLMYRSWYELIHVPGLKAEAGILLPMRAYDEWMNFGENEDSNLCLAHSVVALEREDLANFPVTGGAKWLRKLGTVKKLKRRGWKWPKRGGILGNITVLGCELLLWAHGYHEYYAPDLYEVPDLDLSLAGTTIPVGGELVPMVWKPRSR